MESSKPKRRKYDIEEVNELLEANIELAADIHIDIDKCIHPTVLRWLQNYNDMTSGQPLSLYYALMATIAHLSMESTVLQWNHIPRHLNIYAIIVGYSGVSKSGCVRECREALEELYEFLSTNSIGNPSVVHSILDKFTEAGFMDQLKESTNVIIIQEEVDVALKQMSFFSTNTPDSNRQMFCQLFDGLTMRKKTKGYQQRIRNARMTICGTSTGVLLPPILQDFLKHAMTDGVVVRCLFLVLGYQQYVRQQHVDRSSTLPTIAQLFLTVMILGRRQYVYEEEAQKLVDTYIEELTKQAREATCSRITSFLAKQATQIIRLSALTQIIDLLPVIIENVNINRTSDDMLGINVRLLNEIDQAVRSLFESQIQIRKESTTRAIYFHGYLLEQTLKLFDITSLDNIRQNIIANAVKDLEIVLCRQILLLPKIIITKENLYASNENKKIDRTMGTKSFEALVSNGLLLKNYFIITNTRRPVLCFAKVLPTNDNEREDMSKKLRLYNIQINDYIEVSRSIGVQSPSKLSDIGIQLFTKMPYLIIYETFTATTDYLTHRTSSTSSSSTNSLSSTLTTSQRFSSKSNNYSSITLTRTNETTNNYNNNRLNTPTIDNEEITTSQNSNPLTSSTITIEPITTNDNFSLIGFDDLEPSQLLPTERSRRSTVIRKSGNINHNNSNNISNINKNLVQEDNDIAEEHEIINIEETELHDDIPIIE